MVEQQQHQHKWRAMRCCRGCACGANGGITWYRRAVPLLQVSLLEGRDERMAQSSGGSLSAQGGSPRHRAKLPPAAAEIHLQARFSD